jgi:magnesium-transporting ATPase (P-type)
LLFAGACPGPSAAEPRGPLSLDRLALRPLALVALSDALRPEAGQVLEALASQGIRFKILSGDNPETVRATVCNLPLPLAHEPVLAGAELDAAADRAALIETRSVFGRVAPQQKVEIVTTLQEHGHHVAMIGDGVNDVLPIKRADLGIAMGEGSAASRTVAGLVLENNNFELLPATLDEGRTIVRNVRSAAMLFLLKNVYALFLIMVGSGLLGLAFPYLPQHVTLLDMLTIGVPTLLITLSRQASREPSGTGFLRRIAWFVLSVGLLIGAAGLAVLLLSAQLLHDPVKTQRTLLLSVLIVLGLVALLLVLIRPERRRLFTDRWVRLWAVPALLIYAAVMYCPWTAYFFDLTALTPAQWGLVLAVAAPAALLCALLGGRRGLPIRRLGEP